MARKKTPQLVQIENFTELVRDVNSKAIISADKNAYRIFLERRQREREKTSEIAALRDRLQKLEELVASLVIAK